MMIGTKSIKQAAIQLIPKKLCDERWDDMPAAEKGRICQQCQQQILDFRAKTLEEIAQIHQSTPGQVCGIYRKDQINLQTAHPILQTPKGLKVAAVSLLSIGVSLPTQAQRRIDTMQVQKMSSIYTEIGVKKTRIQSPPPTPEPLLVKDSLTIYGQIIDEDSEEPLAFATVFVPSLDLGVTTDFDGKYQLTVPISKDSIASLKLTMSYIAFENYEISIEDLLKSADQTEAGQLASLKLDVVMKPLDQELVGIILVYKEPIHKRAWRGLKNVFRKKDRATIAAKRAARKRK